MIAIGLKKNIKLQKICSRIFKSPTQTQGQVVKRFATC